MAIAQWSVQVFESATGKIVNNDLPVADFPAFSRVINTSGTVSVKLQLGDRSLGSLTDLRQILAPWRYCIAVCYGGYIAQAGPIITSQFDDSTLQLTISCGDFWSFLKNRIIWSGTAPIQTAGVSGDASNASLLPMDVSHDTNYSVYSLRGVASALVTNGTARSGFGLPVDIPSPEAGTALRNYPVYDLATVYTRLTDLIGVQGGPDVDFKPYFDLTNPGFIRWAMQIGAPLLNVSNTYYWDYGSSCRFISVDSDASNMASAVYAKGNATERASTVAYSVNTALTTAGWPALEAVDSNHTSATDAATIQSYADGDLGLYAVPVETWAATVNVDAASAAFGSYDPGSTGVFTIASGASGHIFIPAGNYAQRVLGFQQDTVATVKLILQAKQGSL